MGRYQFNIPHESILNGKIVMPMVLPSSHTEHVSSNADTVIVFYTFTSSFKCVLVISYVYSSSSFIHPIVRTYIANLLAFALKIVFVLDLCMFLWSS